MAARKRRPSTAKPPKRVWVVAAKDWSRGLQLLGVTVDKTEAREWAANDVDTRILEYILVLAPSRQLELFPVAAANAPKTKTRKRNKT